MDGLSQVRGIAGGPLARPPRRGQRPRLHRVDLAGECGRSRSCDLLPPGAPGAAMTAAISPGRLSTDAARTTCVGLIPPRADPLGLPPWRPRQQRPLAQRIPLSARSHDARARRMLAGVFNAGLWPTAGPAPTGAVLRPDGTRPAAIRPARPLRGFRSPVQERSSGSSSVTQPRHQGLERRPQTASTTTVPRRSEQLLIDHTLSELPGQRQRRWPRKHANVIGVSRRVSARHPGYPHDHH